MSKTAELPVMYKELLAIRDLEAEHGETAPFEVISRVFEARKHFQACTSEQEKRARLTGYHHLLPGRLPH